MADLDAWRGRGFCPVPPAPDTHPDPVAPLYGPCTGSINDPPPGNTDALWWDSVNDTDVVRLSANRLDSRDPITSMRLPVVLRERISEAAPDRSMASVVIQALEEWLARNEPRTTEETSAA